jgi:FKBP-type peptidyl-prolyl cis-trans isomerase
MIRKFIPGTLVLSLVAIAYAQTPAAKPAKPRAAKPAATAPAKTPAAKPEKPETAAPAAETPAKPEKPETATPAVEAPAKPEKPETAAPAADTPAKPQLEPAVIKADSSYALGLRMGSTFSQQFGRFGLGAGDINPENFIKGFMTAVKGDKSEVGDDKLQAAMQALGDLLQAREKEAATANLEAGKKFLEDNGKRKEVTTTKSGLQYEVLAKGGAEKYVAPKEADKDNKQFMVHYKGTLISGKQFDASPEGDPVPMTLQVVEGFKEALTTMPIGAKWKLFLPSNLAYGPERRSADIGPNSVLIFELELVKIQDAPAAPDGGMPFPMPQGAPGGQPRQ